MIAREFFDLFNRKKLKIYIGAEDFTDKLSFLYTVIILILAANVVAAKTYVLRPMACYIPTVPSGSNFKSFLGNYCWVHGTIPLDPAEQLPHNREYWTRLDKTRRINYYQWVPFFLGLQCILFYLPRVLWQLLYSKNSVINIEGILSSATKTLEAGNEVKKKAALKQTVFTIQEILFNSHNQSLGRLERLWNRCLSFFPLSRRMGTHIITTYFLIKCLFLANAIGQLYLIKAFLGYGDKYSLVEFGIYLTSHISNNLHSEVSTLFPRTGMCHVTIRQTGATYNRVVSVCSIPVNMLNEKIFLFLWFWVSLVATLTAFNIVIWWVRICIKKNRIDFIKKFLQMANVIAPGEEAILHRFIDDILCYDGAFLIRMMWLNAGEMVTSSIVCKLWKIYRKKQLRDGTLGECSPTAPAEDRPKLSTNIQMNFDNTEVPIMV